MTISELAQALRSGEITATGLVDRTFYRVNELNPTVNAFMLIDEEGAYRSARIADEERAAGLDRGPLHGIPVAVKDLVDMEGLPTTCGSATSFGAIATEDADVVKRLRDCGAVIVGKTTLHEFAYGATGDRSFYGPSRNPLDPSRMSGGSSGGSAVAVAAGMVPLSIGTDTAGSVRVPAALCGVVGLKPAYNTISTKGVYPLAPSLDHVGLFANTVEDVRLGYEALGDQSALGRERVGERTGERAGERERVGEWAGERAGEVVVGWISPRDIAVTDPRVETVVRELIDRSELGVKEVRPFPRGHGDQTWFEAFSALQGSEAFRVHEHHLDSDRELIDPEVLARLEAGGRVTPGLYAQAEEARDSLRGIVDGLLQDFDILALPTVPIVAPEIGARSIDVAGNNLEVRSALLSLTSPWNLTGIPAISVPAGHLEGLPVAIQLLVAPGNERTMFAAAQALHATITRTH